VNQVKINGVGENGNEYVYKVSAVVKIKTRRSVRVAEDVMEKKKRERKIRFLAFYETL
jgi:hypothetical protein